MPDLGELVLLLVVGGVVAAVVATPFVRRRRAAARGDAAAANAADPGAADPDAADASGVDASGDLEVLLIRHRVALEAVRDVDADWRAGSLDDAAHAEQREAAERRATETLSELEAARSGAAAPGNATRRGAVPGRRIVAAAAVLVVAVIVGFALPAPFSLANPVRVNQALADQQKQEADRQATIQQELGVLTRNPTDTAALSKLADAYLAGGTSDDIARGAQMLLALISLDSGNASAYQRLITAYIQVADWKDAAAATDAYARIAKDSPDIPFFRGVIALQGTRDDAEAIRQFNAFLAAAPDDPRATMVRALLSQAQSSAPAQSTGPAASATPAS